MTNDVLAAALGLSKPRDRTAKGKGAPDPLERALGQVLAGQRLQPQDQQTVRVYLARHRTGAGQIRPEAIRFAAQKVRQGPMGLLSLDYGARMPQFKEMLPAKKAAPAEKVARNPQPVSRDLQVAMAAVDRARKENPLSKRDRATVRTYLARRVAPDGSIHPKAVAEAVAMAKQVMMGVDSLRYQNRQPTPRPKTVRELEDSLRFTPDALEKVFHHGQGDTPVRTKDGKQIQLRDAIDEYRGVTGRHFESSGDRYASENAVDMYTVGGRFRNPADTRFHGGKLYEPRIQKDRRLYGTDLVDKGFLFPVSYATWKLRGDAVSKKELDAIEKSPIATVIRRKVREPLSFVSGAIGTGADLLDAVDMVTGQGGRKGEVNGLRAASDLLRDRKTEEGIDLPFGWGRITSGDIFSTAGAAVASAVPGMGVGRVATAARWAPKVVKALTAATNAGIQAGSNAGSSFRQAVDAGESPDVARKRAYQAAAIDGVTSAVLGKFGGGKGGRLMKGIRSAALEGLEEAGQQVTSNYVSKGKFSTEGMERAAIMGAVMGAGSKAFDSKVGSEAGVPPPPPPRFTEKQRAAIQRSPMGKHPQVRRMLKEDAARAAAATTHRQRQVEAAQNRNREVLSGHLATPSRKRGGPVAVQKLSDEQIDSLVQKRDRQLARVSPETSPAVEAALRHDRSELQAERARRYGGAVSVAVDPRTDYRVNNRSAPSPSLANPRTEARPGKVPMLVETRNGDRFFVRPQQRKTAMDARRAESPESTVYIAPADPRKLAALLRSEEGGAKRVTVLADGRLALQYASEPKRGKIVPSSAIRVSATPVGMNQTIREPNRSMRTEVGIPGERVGRFIQQGEINTEPAIRDVNWMTSMPRPKAGLQRSSVENHLIPEIASRPEQIGALELRSKQDHRYSLTSELRSDSQEGDGHKKYLDPPGWTHNPPLPVIPMGQSRGRKHLDCDEWTTEKSFIERIRNLEVEVTAIFKDGRLQFAPLVGYRDRMDIGSIYPRFWWNTDIIHNHPTGKIFSYDDLGSCWALKLRSLTAVLPQGGQIVIRRPDQGWPEVTQSELFTICDDAKKEASRRHMEEPNSDLLALNIEELNFKLFLRFGYNAPGVELFV